MASREETAAGMRSVMHALSLELRHLGHTGVVLQTTLGQPQAGDYEGPQTLDLLTQSLFELADFLTNLVPAVDPSFKAELEPALAQIRLSDMARRLASTSLDEIGRGLRCIAIPLNAPEAGVMDLF